MAACEGGRGVAMARHSSCIQQLGGETAGPLFFFLIDLFIFSREVGRPTVRVLGPDLQRWVSSLVSVPKSCRFLEPGGAGPPPCESSGMWASGSDRMMYLCRRDAHWTHVEHAQRRCHQSKSSSAVWERQEGLLHNVVELQHGVRGGVDEDVGQRVLLVVHLVWGKDTGDLQCCSGLGPRPWCSTAGGKRAPGLYLRVWTKDARFLVWLSVQQILLANIWKWQFNHLVN